MRQCRHATPAYISEHNPDFLPGFNPAHCVFGGHGDRLIGKRAVLRDNLREEKPDADGSKSPAEDAADERVADEKLNHGSSFR